MAAPATEIAFITLKPGIEIEGATTEAKAWQETLSTVSSQAGFQRCYYGRQLEDPTLLYLVIDWDSKDSHLKFIADPSYGPFKKVLGSIMDGVHLHHMIQPNTKLLGTAPVTEVVTFYDVDPSMLSSIEKFAAALEKGKPYNYYGAVYGQTMEKIVLHKDVGNEDVKPADAIVLLIGWASKEAHLAFTETELFKDNIALLTGNHGDAEIVHVPFKAV